MDEWSWVSFWANILAMLLMIFLVWILFRPKVRISKKLAIEKDGDNDAILRFKVVNFGPWPCVDLLVSARLVKWANSSGSSGPIADDTLVNANCRTSFIPGLRIIEWGRSAKRENSVRFPILGYRGPDSAALNLARNTVRKKASGGHEVSICANDKDPVWVLDRWTPETHLEVSVFCRDSLSGIPRIVTRRFMAPKVEVVPGEFRHGLRMSVDNASRQDLMTFMDSQFLGHNLRGVFSRNAP